MAPDLRTPGVYIEEIRAFQNSVIPVPTSIPVFIGYTQNTSHDGTNLLNRAVRVISLADYITKFGSDLPLIAFNLAPSVANIDLNGANGQAYSLNAATMFYRMFAAMKFFYMNGGSECYVISIGDYNSPFDKTKFIHAIDLLINEPDPSILVIPEAIMADVQSAYDIQNYMIRHCSDTKNKFTILDVPEGYKDLVPSLNCVDNFRNGVGNIIASNNSYAAAYYPWLHTTVHDLADINYLNIATDSYSVITSLLTAEFTDPNGNIDPVIAQQISCFTNNGDSDNGSFTLTDADSNLRNISVQYRLVLEAIRDKLNLMPPSSAMAGIYTAVDVQRGVWKAPANVTLQNVVSPSVAIDNDQQQDLNAPISGKSICAIRTFPGRGNLVWGARTLDGNSSDFRYINVRRTLIFIEQSIKEAIKAFVFATNDANTWARVESMISNFLNDLWRQGALVGPIPADAFDVHIGLGETMTAEDLLNGIMRVSVVIALQHPAEFIVISVEQQMQES
jgi:hypothetical protein